MSELIKQPNVKFTKIMAWIGFVVILLAAIISFIYFYLLFFPQPIMTFDHTDALDVDKTVVSREGRIGMYVDYCKTSPAIPRVTVGFIDSILIGNFVTVRNLPMGCHHTRLDFDLPRSVVADTYTLLVEVHYDNAAPFHDETHQLISKPFQVK